MKKIGNILLLVLLLPLSLYASTRGDVKIIEASENIRYLGQKISKEYLFFYQNPKKLELKDGIYDDIKLLEQSIIDIETITNNKDSKNILDFLAYNKDEIKELIEKPVDIEKSILMLDYSESFLEGANAIENAHKYNFSLEEKMLMMLKDVEYLLERASKYYIAYTLDIDKQNNFNNMNQAIEKIEKILKEVNSYHYPKALFAEVREMNSSWSKYKQVLYKVKKLSIPSLILTSTTNFEKSIKKIALYHKQNQ
ncbi:MAG: hypothetical protein GXO60_05855 [Epsilonproteobacteria bacterium]|nr:hypothetical protein [Campylobacterota bacterium]